jgi:WD repeat-containing protein 42A
VITSSEDEGEVARRSRVRARRVVRAGDLGTVEGEEEAGESSSSSSSDTDEDGTPSGTFISDRAKEVIFKPNSRPRHSLVSDLVSRQMGLRMAPSFTSRRCGSADLVKRLKLAAKLSGHEGCVNCLNFNQAGTKIASGSDDLNIIVWEWERGR